MATYYLIVPAYGVPRVTKRRPNSNQIKESEIVFPLEVTRPAGYGKINWDKPVTVKVPDATTVGVKT